MFFSSTNMHCLLLLALFLLVSQVSTIVTNESAQTISPVSSQQTNQTNELIKSITQPYQIDTSNNKTDPLDRNLMSGRDNATFYYNSDSFLLQTNFSGEMTKNDKKSSNLFDNRTISTGENSTKDISGRNGRMLDLDELVGDFEQARLNKQNRVSGSRQSRILNDSPIEIGQGKKLSIQGFIPIMSIKDINSGDKDDNLPSESISKKSLAGTINQEDNVQTGSHADQYLSSSSLPYSQSSVGHASIGIKPDPDSYNDNQMGTENSNYLAQQQQSSGIDAKYLGSTTSSLLNPFKRLQNKKLSTSGGLSMLNSLISGGSLSSFSHSTINNAGSDSNQSQDNTDAVDCVCVPFYMCHSGYLSESSLTKDQIHQIIQSHQQQQQLIANQFPRNNLLGKQNNEEPSYSAVSNQIQSIGQPITLQQQQQQEQHQLQQDTYVPVDERSMDSINGVSQKQNLNDTHRPTSLELSNGEEATPLEQQFNNTQNNLTHYSQDILGRMLGIKNEAACGTLRTCCRVVMNPPQNQDSGQRVASSTQFQNQKQQHQSVPYHQPASQTMAKPLSQHQQMPISLSSMQLHHQQQQNALQKFYPSTMTSPAFNQMYPDSFSHRQQQQTRRQGPNSFTNIAPQMTPIQQPNLNQRANQPYVQAPLNHRMNMKSDQSVPNTLLQPYQSIKPFGVPSTASSSIHLQYLQAPSAQYQQAHSQSNVVDYSRSGLQHNYQLAPALRPQMIETSQVMNQLSPPPQRQALPSSLSRSSPPPPLSPLSNQKRMLEGRCGLRNAAGITGRIQNLQYHDNSAEFAEFPSQAAILKRLGQTDDSLYACAATLISHQWLATAAHCIRKFDKDDLKVRLGDWDVHRDDEFYPHMEKKIRDIVIHSEFVPGALLNDIALLRMESPIDPNLPHISPACLPNSDEIFTGLRCWVTGWGKDAFGQRGTFQSVLKKVDLPVLGHNECENSLRQTKLGQTYRLHPGFICAGGERGKDACEGDGGSGLYCIGPDGLIKAAGLVSWGIGCGQAGVPGVYANLAHYRSWIESIISVDEDLYNTHQNVASSNSLISERSPGANNSIGILDGIRDQDIKAVQTSQESGSAKEKEPSESITVTVEPIYITSTTGTRNDQLNQTSEEFSVKITQ